jgi:hypothetical protein
VKKKEAKLLKTKKSGNKGSDLSLHISFNFRDAEGWDVLQHIQMTPDQRQEIARELRRRVYGDQAPDVREAHRISK